MLKRVFLQTGVLVSPNYNKGGDQVKATLFKEIVYSLSKLIEDIDMGEIGK